MNIWFTSDSHYGHSSISGPELSKWKSGYRTFKTVQEMNECLIDTINKYVKEDDILYHLGDFSFGSPQKMYDFRKSLICKTIHLIKGNHDEIFDEFNEEKRKRLSFDPFELFTSVRDIMEVRHDSMYYELLRKTDMLFKIENRKRKIENLLCKI